MYIYKHKFITYLWNGVEFKDYTIVCNNDRKLAKSKLNLLIDSYGYDFVNKGKTEFKNYRWLDE